MFQKNENGGDAMDTVIGSSIKVEGSFVGQGNIIVEGEVKGNLKTSQNLEAGSESKITANIEAANALIAGEVDGKIKIEEHLELTGTAKINGDIEANVLVVASGATINGYCKIGAGEQESVKESLLKKQEEDEE
ncbi:MAG: polymer-forming cytoskeletal protein [bacterium]